MSGFASSAGGGFANKKIPDWTELNTTESLINLFENHEMSSIEPDFGFCAGIHSDSNIKTAYDEVRSLTLDNPSITLGAIFTDVTDTGVTDYDATLTANQWLKVWLTQKFISTYGESIIMDVYKKYMPLLGNDKDIYELREYVSSTGITISFDMHGELNIQPDGKNVYKNVSEILGGTLPKSSLLYNPSIFDKTVRLTKSYEEIMEEQRQITIIDLQNFIVKRDACRNMVYEISNKITEHHHKISVLQNSLYETASQEMTQSQVSENASQVSEHASQLIEHASQVNEIALDVIDEANEIAENIGNEIEDTLTPQIASTPTFSPGEELATLTNNVNQLYGVLGAKITKLDELVKDVKDTYISLRSILYYNLSNPQAALRELDQTLFSGTNEENGGLGIVLTLVENEVVTDCVRYYLRKTFGPNITFDVNGLTITKNGSKVDAYNPSEAMNYNLWNIFRNSNRGKYPSFAWLFMMYCVLHNPANQGAHLPREAIKVLTMTLFDDCTHSQSDNAISEILRTMYKEGNTTDIKSELLYKFLETLGIKYNLNLLHCMGKPSTELIEDFKTKVKEFGDKYIAEENRMAFDRRIAEIGATQTLGSQESMPPKIDYFNNKVAALSRMTQTLSPNSPHYSPHSPSHSPPHLESNFVNSQDSDDPINSYNPDVEDSQNSNKFVVLYGSSDDEERQNYNNFYGESQEKIAANYEDDEKQLFPLSQKHFIEPHLKRNEYRCRFSHDPNANVNYKGVGVCYPFQKGDCKRGDKCKFSHYGGSIRTTKRKRKGGRKTRRPKKNKRTRRTKDRAKYTRKR